MPLHVKSLRRQVIRLASAEPHLRADLLPLLRTAQEGGEEADTKGKGKGMPSSWYKFLDQKYEGGKKKVTNTNPKTKDRYPQVSFGTRMKNDQNFKKSVMKEYRDWLDSSKEKSPSKPSPAKEEAKPAKSPGKGKKPKAPAKGKGKVELVKLSGKQPKMKRTPAPAGMSKQIRAIVGPTFDMLSSQMKKGATAHLDKLKKKAESGSPKDVLNYKSFEAMSEPERMFTTGGHLVGQMLQNFLPPNLQEKHEEVMEGWRDGIGTPSANQLYGYLDTLGVAGGPAPWDKQSAKDNRKKGAADKELAAWAGRQYAFAQAYFEHIGLKEVTVYRGIKAQGLDKDPPSAGDDVELATREASSFSLDPGVAYDFGRPVAYKIPVERIFASSVTDPGIGGEGAAGSWGENEVIVMGATDLKGKVMLEPGMEGMGKQSN